MSQNYDSSALDIEDEMESTAKRLRQRLYNHEGVSVTATNVPCTSEIYRDGQVGIINLPTEILEVIFENLSYHEISKVREVCRHFRDVCNEILNRAVHKLNDCLHQHVKLLEEADEAYLKRFHPEVLKRDSKINRVRKSGTLICRRWLLVVLGIKLSLLRAVCYRFFFLNDISPSICYPRCFFAGKILDEVQRILTLVRLGRLEAKDMNVDVFLDLVDTFIDFFHDRIELTLVRNEAIINRATLFGSKVIDILNCCLDCKKNINVSEDSKGWCHLRGEYKLRNLFFTCLSSKQVEFQDLEPLTVKEQRILHECLFSIIDKANEWCLKANQIRYNNVRVGRTGLQYPRGIYKGIAEYDNSVFYYGYRLSNFYIEKSVLEAYIQKEVDEIGVTEENEVYGVDGQGRFCLIIDGHEMNNIGEEEDEVHASDLDEEEMDGYDRSTDPGITIKVELKCRKELAPVEVLLGETDSSNEQHKYESSIDVTDHDLVLRLEIICPKAAMYENRLPPVYRCLIKQKYLLEEPLPATSEEDVASLWDNNNRSDIFTVRDRFRVTNLR